METEARVVEHLRVLRRLEAEIMTMAGVMLEAVHLPRRLSAACAWQSALAGEGSTAERHRPVDRAPLHAIAADGRSGEVCGPECVAYRLWRRVCNFAADTLHSIARAAPLAVGLCEIECGRHLSRACQ